MGLFSSKKDIELLSRKFDESVAKITSVAEPSSLQQRIHQLEAQVENISNELGNIHGMLHTLMRQINGITTSVNSPYLTDGRPKRLRPMEESFLIECRKYLYLFEQDYITHLDAHEDQQQETRKQLEQEKQHIADKKAEFFPPLTTTGELTTAGNHQHSGEP